jgi:hypothetical protein
MRCFLDLGIEGSEVGWKRCARLRRVGLHGAINAGGRHDHDLFETSGSTVSRPLSINSLIMIWV